MRTVIVGGVAGGMSAATRLRRLDENAQIVVFERGEHVSFANCGLPYYVGSVIPRRENLLLQTPAALEARFGLDVRVRHEVTGIDPAAQTVAVRNLGTGETTIEAYDHLVLSVGAAPFVPPIPGIERGLTLRNVADVDRIAAQTERALSAGGRAVVIGAGFIGVEMAENLRRRELDVSLIELADQVMPPLDPELAALVADELLANGVGLHLGVQVQEITDDAVLLSSGQRIPADLVVVSIGVRPESALAVAAGIEVGDLGGVLVDDQLRTSAPNVFAVGDMVQKRDRVTGGASLVPLANLANKQGRRVADLIAGRASLGSAVGTLDSAVGTAVVQVFGLTAAAVGPNVRRLRQAGRSVLEVHTHPTSHAGYYPGAVQMHLKLLVDPETGEILGAQGVGAEGVARRIDVIATAMAGRLRATDLIDLELAYAPQYGSAKDPVNLLGYVAENALGLDSTVQWHALADRPAVVVDVRTAGEFAKGAIPAAVNIPVDELRQRHNELPDGPLVVYCQVGQRGHVAADLLTQLGHQTANLDGGWLTWSAGQRSRQLAQQTTHREDKPI